MVELAKKVYLFIFVAFICQKLFFHNGAGGHWIYVSRKKCRDFREGYWGLIFFKRFKEVKSIIKTS